MINKNISNLVLSIAKRAKYDAPTEVVVHGIDCHEYRFDLNHVHGDFEIVAVPSVFSSEEAARAELYRKLFADMMGC